MKITKHIAENRKKLTVVLILVLIVLPFVFSSYVVRLATYVFMWAGLAVAWNITGGLTGYVAFGNAAFVGIGAYTMAILMLKFHVPFLIGMFAGGIVSCLAALLTGGPLLRLKGHYFALATLGFAEAIRGIVENWESLTKGGAGLTLPMMGFRMEFINKFFYFQMFAILIIVMFLFHIITRSRLGYGLVAIREDEDAAGILGVKQTDYKLIAYAISAFFTGLIGTGYAYWMTYIDPVDVFSMDFSLQPVIVCLLGGLGTLWGPVIGTLIWEILSEIIWGHFLHVHQGIMGIVMILVLFFIPKGFMALLKSRRESFVGMLLENVGKYRV